MDAVITQYSPKDQKKVKKLILEELSNFGFGYDQKYDFDLDDPSYYINSGGAFFVLKTGKDVIGTIAVINNGKSGELKRLYVNKNFQGKGFGSKLLDRAIQFCRENHFNFLNLETNKKFTTAHNLYKKHGFAVESEDENSFYMKKTLTI